MTTGQGDLPTAQRNSKPGRSLLEQIGFAGDTDQRHPGEVLFDIGDLKDLVIKSDIPEAMAKIISRMLWKAERYKIPALQSLVEWYLICRLPVGRQAREEYIRVVIGEKLKAEESEDLLGKGR